MQRFRRRRRFVRNGRRQRIAADRFWHGVAEFRFKRRDTLAGPRIGDEHDVFADRKSPIAYGYDEKLAVYFNQSPLLQVAAIGQGGFGGGGAGSRCRHSQQAGLRAVVLRPILTLFRDAKPPETGQPAPTPDPSQIPPLASRPRVVLRFATAEKDLLISGMLAGGSELAGKAAVVDVPVGKAMS